MPTPRETRPTTLADHLSVISRAVFSAGLSWKIIDDRWDAFEAAFSQFDPRAVAAMDDAALDLLMQNERLIRSRKKFAATVSNARALIDIEREHGSIDAWLGAFTTFAEAAKEVHKRFKFLSKTFGAYYYIYITGVRMPDFPSFEAWSSATNEDHPRMRELVERREARTVLMPELRSPKA